MPATVHEGRIELVAPDGITITYAGEYDGYYARCEECDWTSNFHAIGLESAPNASALQNAAAHNVRRHG